MHRFVAAAAKSENGNQQSRAERCLLNAYIGRGMPSYMWGLRS
jgi:hypothetical protein